MEGEAVNFDDNVVKDLLTGKTLFEIYPNNTDMDRVKAKSKLSFGASDHLAPFMQQLPSLFAAKQLAESYRLVFPPGVVGKLMKHVNDPYLRGMSTSSIVNARGTIIDKAGFDPSSYALQAPLIGFVIASAITGQYFQAKTEKALRVISHEVEKIAQLILADKEAQLRSIYHFSEHVKSNIDYIQSNEQLRAATLVNVQRNNIELYSLMKFYEKTIQSELGTMQEIGKEIISAKITYGSELQSLSRSIGILTDQFQRNQICLDLYMLGRISEIQLASTYDDGYLTNLARNFNSLKNQNAELIEHVSDIHTGCFAIPRVRDDNTLEIGKKEKKLRDLEKRKSNTDNSILELIDGIKEIIDLNRDGMECVYTDQQLYLVSNAA